METKDLVEKEQWMDFIIERLAEVLDMDIEDIDPEEDFFSLGLSSIKAIKVISSLKELTEKEIDLALIFDCENVNDLVETLHAL